MAKVVKVNLASAGYNTIPGATADLTRDGTQLDDTIFGQIFSSVQPGLINWGVSANAFYKGFAGYVATLKRSGAVTPMVDKEMEEIGSSKVWRMTSANAAFDLWDRNDTFVFNEADSAAADITSDVVSINHLLGEVTFTSTHAAGVTVTGDYISLVAFGNANTFSLSQTAETTDTTSFEDAQGNSGFNVFAQTLLGASLELSGFYNVSNDFTNILKGRAEIVIEINPDGKVATTENRSYARGFFKMATDSQTGDVAGSETETVNFFLFVPEGLGAAPFQWRHGSGSTLSQSIQDLLTAWATQVEILVDYLPDGSTGYRGNAVVSDISLAGGVDVMNEFTVSLQGTGALAIV